MELFGNNASTTLNGSITSGATSLIVTSATNFPTSGNFRILVDSGINLEYMLVTAVSGTTFTVTRGIEGTTGVAHNSLVQVVHVITAGGLSNLLASPPRLLALDSNDLLAWRMGEAFGSTTFANSGTAGAVPLTIVNSILPAAPTLFGPTPYWDGGTFSGTRDHTTGGTSTIPTTACTLSCWHYIISFPGSNNWNIVSKTYRPLGSWASPFESMSLYGLTATVGGGPWIASIVLGTTGSGTQYTVQVTDHRYHLFPGTWNHIGMTWDSATNLLIAYLNGVAVGQTATTGSTIDPNTSPGYWLLGATPDAGANEVAQQYMLDVRVGTIARPASYFATAYETGLRYQPA